MDLFYIVGIITIILFIGTVIFFIVKGVKQWIRNINSPIISVHGKVVAKSIFYSNSRTNLVAFQIENGDTREFRVNLNEYELLKVGDVGVLTFQGKRYKGFSKTM